MSNTYKRQKIRQLHQEVGAVTKRQMICALMAQRIRQKHPRISPENIVPMANFLGFFVWLFSLPYDGIKRLLMKRKIRRASAKIKSNNDK